MRIFPPFRRRAFFIGYGIIMSRKKKKKKDIKKRQKAASVKQVDLQQLLNSALQCHKEGRFDEAESVTKRY